jgi:hypothetical protein
VVFTNYTEQTPMRMGANCKLYVGASVANSGAVVFDAEWSDF